MSAPDRCAFVDRCHAVLLIRRHCEVLGIARWGVYRPPLVANETLICGASIARVAILSSGHGHLLCKQARQPCRSELGHVGYRHVIVEEVRVVLDANILGHRSLPALVGRAGLPRPVERVGVIHRDIYFQHVAAVDQVPALHGMKLLGVRRAESVDDGPAVQ
jgi:hypothetical protein